HGVSARAHRGPRARGTHVGLGARPTPHPRTGTGVRGAGRGRVPAAHGAARRSAAGSRRAGATGRLDRSGDRGPTGVQPAHRGPETGSDPKALGRGDRTMNPRSPVETLTSAPARRVDEVCDRFEAACREGRWPRIEDYLDQCPDEARGALLHELVQLDEYYRREDYRKRFPELDPA